MTWSFRPRWLGKHPRPVLWATPRPHLLIVRHDRPLTLHDWPVGWATSVSHTPYWWPPNGALIEGAVVVDAGQSGQSHGQWDRQSARWDQSPPSVPGRAQKRPHRVRRPEAMVEVLAGRLAGVLDDLTVTLAGSWHLTGQRPKDGRVQHSNHTLLRFQGRVVDEPAMRDLMTVGVGRNRSFGCGLILARPVGVPAC